MSNALVTGGTRGIGRAISEKLCSLGHNVTAIYHRDDASAMKFQSETNIEVAKVDVANFTDCSEFFASAVDYDILVNNAGIVRDSFLHKMDASSWSDVISVCLDSVYNTCRYVIPRMRENGYGKVVNISSVNAYAGQLGQTNYSAAKMGLIGFTRSLALECAKFGITVNSVSPGYIRTDMTESVPNDIMDKIIDQIPQKRLGLPSEIAAVVAFLIGEEASYITGADLAVNGGMFMK